MSSHRVAVAGYPVGMGGRSGTVGASMAARPMVNVNRANMVAVSVMHMVVAGRRRTGTAHRRRADRGSHREAHMHTRLCPAAANGQNEQTEDKKVGKEILFHTAYIN